MVLINSFFKAISPTHPAIKLSNPAPDPEKFIPASAAIEKCSKKAKYERKIKI